MPGRRIREDHREYRDLIKDKVKSRVKDHISEKFGPPKTILKMKSRQTVYRWKHQDIKIKNFKASDYFDVSYNYWNLTNTKGTLIKARNLCMQY